MPYARLSLSLCVAILLLAAHVTHAAMISELFRADPANPNSPPDAIELVGLDGHRTVDLLVVNAGGRGRSGPAVLQVISIPVTSDVLLIAADDWVAPGWYHQPNPAQIVTLPGLGHAGFAWDGPRTLLLYTGPTHLFSDFSLFDPSTQNVLANHKLLDQVTFASADATIDDRLPEAAFALEPGHAAARPYNRNGAPSATWLSGQPDAHGNFSHLNPTFTLTPAALNLSWSPDVPEPGTAGMILLGLAALLYRSRHPHHRSCR